MCSKKKREKKNPYAKSFPPLSRFKKHHLLSMIAYIYVCWCVPVITPIQSFHPSPLRFSLFPRSPKPQTLTRSYHIEPPSSRSCIINRIMHIIPPHPPDRRRRGGLLVLPLSLLSLLLLLSRLGRQRYRLRR